MQMPEISKCLVYTPLKNVITQCMQAVCIDAANPRSHMQFMCLFHMTGRHIGLLNSYVVLPAFITFKEK